jgi:hypothetical protein
LLNSGNGSLFITLNREEPIDAPTISVELQDGQSTETVELPADATEEQIEDAAREWADDLCPFCEAGGIRSPADSDAPWVGVDVGNTEPLYGWLCRSCMDAGIDLG